jgi:hypothetical protein
MPRRERLRPSPSRPRRASGADAGRPEPAPDRRNPAQEEPVAVIGIIGDLVHGVAFLLLAAAALYYFGRIFWVVSAAMAALCVVSLREAWSGLRRVRESRKA